LDAGDRRHDELDENVGRMPKRSVNGINLHYWQVGDGPDLVMIHGLNGNLAVWHLELMPRLRSEYRITTYDLRGHGRSDMPPAGYSTAHMAQDLLGLLDALGIERAHLMGHSLGADISLHTALLQPERVQNLILLEPGIPALIHLRKKEDWEGWAYWAQMIKEFTGIDVPREKWMDLNYMIRLSVTVPIIYGPAKGLPRKADGVLRLLETTTMVQDYEDVGDLTLDNLATIPHKKLLLYDSGSPYRGTYEVLRDLLINCRPVLLPPSKHRHFGVLEQADLLLRHVREFLVASDSTAASAEGAPPAPLPTASAEH